MELTLSKEAQNAIWQIIHKSSNITPKDIAQVTGDSHNTICNYANVNMPNHIPSLKKIETIMLFTGNPALLKAWAHKMGFMLIPTNDSYQDDHQLCVLESLLDVNVSTGQINQQVLEAMRDHVVTPCELVESIKILEETEEKMHALRKALEAQTAKYLSALPIKKA